MDEFEIEVIGTGPPRKRGRPLKRMTGMVGRKLRAVLMRPRALVFTGATAFLLFIGTPHAGWDYGCRGSIRPGETCRSVSYCAYYGIQGRRVVFPQDGQSCGLITFLPPDWGKLMGAMK